MTKEITTTISRSKRWRADKKMLGNRLGNISYWHWRTGKKWTSWYFEHATGSGKTYTAICAIRDALDRHKSVLVLVPSKELLRQWHTEFVDNIRDIDIKYLLCGDGHNNWKTKIY